MNLKSHLKNEFDKEKENIVKCSWEMFRDSLKNCKANGLYVRIG